MNTTPRPGEELLRRLDAAGGDTSSRFITRANLIAHAAAEIRRLQSIVEKLPMSKDGVRIIPGIDHVWGYTHRQHGLVEMAVVLGVDSGMWATFSGDDRQYVSECYSTRAAALAAAAAPGPAEGDERSW